VVARVTVPRNPLTAVTVMLELSTVPRTIVRLVGWRERVKFGGRGFWDRFTPCVEEWNIAIGPSTAVIRRRAIMPSDNFDVLIVVSYYTAVMPIT
jgi:hypothetical protein